MTFVLNINRLYIADIAKKTKNICKNGVYVCKGRYDQQQIYTAPK
jgi:hypothetical protein